MAYLFCIFTLLYINIPIVFVLLNNTYEFGIGINSIPYKQKEYHDILPIATVFLTFFWCIIWAAIISVKFKFKELSVNKYKDIKISAIGVVGLVVLVITYFDNTEIMSAYLDENFVKKHSLSVFIFFDHAYLILAGFLLAYKINTSKRKKEASRASYYLFLIFLSFLWVMTGSGSSQAAIIPVTTLLFIYPISLFNQYKGISLLIPSNSVIITFFCLSPVFFYIIFLQRLDFHSGNEISEIGSYISRLSVSSFYDILEAIMYRLSAGAFEQYILIFKSFTSSFDFYFSAYFVEYLSKSFVNLAWPGTPYFEAFSPSSNFLPNALSHNSFESDVSNTSELIRSFNTQPYTIFGLSLILFGFFLAPVVVYIFYYLVIILYNYLNYDFMKLAILYFFMGSLSSYGFEVVVANSAHLFISMIVMYYLVIFLSKYKQIINKILKF